MVILPQGVIIHGNGEQVSQTGYKSHRLFFEENKEFLMILWKNWKFKVVFD